MMLYWVIIFFSMLYMIPREVRDYLEEVSLWIAVAALLSSC